MQVQENDGGYRKPEELDKDLEGRENALARKIEKLLGEENVRRVLIFPAYGEDGRPSAEMRRAWRRYDRTRRAR